MADAGSLSGLLDDSISRAPLSDAFSPVPAMDYNSPDCCATSWSYELTAGTEQTSAAFSANMWPSSAWNSVPAQYPGADYQYVAASDSSDSVFTQIGYEVDNNGNEVIFSWTTQANGALCVNGAMPAYYGNGCQAPFSSFGITNQAWIQFWIYQDNGTDVLYVNSTPFMERTAAAPGHLYYPYVSGEVSPEADFDMTTMIGAGLGLGGFFAYFSSWTGSVWMNQTPLTAESEQFDDAGHWYSGNYFTQRAACGPAAYFGQYEPYGAGSGGYEDGAPNAQCVGDGAMLPGS